jgi:hypothetical protein
MAFNLGVDQLTIHADLKTPPVRWNERQLGDVGLEFLQQFGRQTGGPIGVLSNSTILDLDFDRHTLLHKKQMVEFESLYHGHQLRFASGEIYRLDAL